MKKTLILIAAGLVALTASAQQALWGGSQIVSPEVHADHSVTFRLMAPNASSVQVTGDFLPTIPMETPRGTFDGPGVADLVKNAEGVWEYTCEPLSPELYMYTFLVDGLKINDPSNVYSIRDVASVTNIFIIDGDEQSELYKVNDVPHGSVSRVWYDSPELGFDRRLTIYTPAGYETSGESYPVLYLLHGGGGDEEAWIALGRASQILDNLVAQGKAKPMIVVMPNCNPNQEAAAGESHFGLIQPRSPQYEQAKSQFELSFPEIINYVEKNYRAIPQKSARAICGLSMGGFYTFHISKYYPDCFDYIGLYSAAISTGNRNAESPVYTDLEGKLATLFAGKPALYWIAIGRTDFLYNANVELRAMLDAKGYPYEYHETDGGHIWRNWRIYLSLFAQKLF